MSGTPLRWTSKCSADGVMIPSVSPSGVRVPPTSSVFENGDLSLDACSKRERSPYGLTGPPRSFDVSSGAGWARLGAARPAVASAAPSATPRFRKRRRSGSGDVTCSMRDSLSLVGVLCLGVGPTSERDEIGDGREWTDHAVSDETPKASLGEMLGAKPAFRHQELGGFVHDGMSQPAIPFPPRAHRGFRVNGQQARSWSGRQPPHLAYDTGFVAHRAPRVRQASGEVKADAERNGRRIPRDELQLASVHTSARLDHIGVLVIHTDADS